MTNDFCALIGKFPHYILHLSVLLLVFFLPNLLILTNSKEQLLVDDGNHFNYSSDFGVIG